VGLVRRYPVSLAVVVAAVAALCGFFVFARPRYRPAHQGVEIKLPAKQPAADASGAAGWVWPDGVPGWEAGYTIKDVNISFVQPVELQAAQLAAARAGLDAERVRVVSETRANSDGVLAIVAAPTLYHVPEQTCLAAVFQGDAPVVWECPGNPRPQADLAESRVLVAAAAFRWPRSPVLYLAGVARGDVYRIDVVAPGLERRTLYTRDVTWGQFSTAMELPRAGARLEIYGRHGRLERIPLDVRPGQQRAIYSR
jgi:hypothetical protein